jgi:NAD(P)-dependent dehydrogenase (short-subunit alcohol dehydrogenase family)
MNRTILVVGASSSIAAETAQLLTDQGHTVLQWSRSEVPGGSVVTDYVTGDLPELPDSLDGVIYFPGTVRLAPFHRISLDQFREDWEINVGGFIRIVQETLPKLQKGTDPAIVGISTVAVQTGLGFHASVSQAKGALEGLVRALAAEYAPKGIRVNGVAPSLTESNATASMVNTDEKRERMGKRHPLGRIGAPRDIAEAVSFLVGDRSTWITGQVLGVDGGFGVLRQ